MPRPEANVNGPFLALRAAMLFSIILFLCLFPSKTVFATPKEYPPLAIAVGEQRLLRIPGLARYSLGSDVIRVHPLPKNADSAQESLLMKGVHAGMGDLWVWKKDGSADHRSIQVVKSADDGLTPALERSLGRLEETEIIYSGNGVVLRGETQTLAESARIAALVQAFPKEILDETEPANSLLKLGQRKLESWLKQSPYASKLKIERSDQSLWIRGSINSPSEQNDVKKRILALFPLTHVEIQNMPDDSPTVHFKVFLLELKRNRFGSFGLEWPDNQPGAFQVTSSGIQNALQLNLTLHELEGDGSAKILSNPELVVRAPGEAELFSGGELPIQLQSTFYSNVTWKTFGLTLHLKVSQTTTDRVRLDIKTEISHLDPSLATDKIPGIQTNRMTTQVDAQYGAPLFLSGLLQQETREQARGLPFLRDIPVLGALFGSDDYLHERSELVAILLPNRNPPRAPMERVTRTIIPRGPVPPPRNWISMEKQRELEESPNYPWNAVE